MTEFTKKIFSFHFADIVGLCVGFVLLFSFTDNQLFKMVISPQMYLITFLISFLFHSWIWLFVLHGESAYTKQMALKVIKDFYRIVLSVVSTIGVYFLIQALLG
ncbi:MAG: hypothetical protein E7013_03700 [Alphaproteobacteria bacterium]|nr:hypothetical protein [Alphaproteobacteria bacterium]